MAKKTKAHDGLSILRGADPVREWRTDAAYADWWRALDLIEGVTGSIQTA